MSLTSLSLDVYAWSGKAYGMPQLKQQYMVDLPVEEKQFRSCSYVGSVSARRSESAM